MKLSLIVPCYNEEDNVEAFYEATRQAFAHKEFSYEFTLKDGRSCIATWNSSDEKKDLALDLGCESVTVSDIYGNDFLFEHTRKIFVPAPLGSLNSHSRLISSLHI